MGLEKGLCGGGKSSSYILEVELRRLAEGLEAFGYRVPVAKVGQVLWLSEAQGQS